MLSLAHFFLCLSWWRASRTIDAADYPPRDDRGCCRAECVHYLWTASSPLFNDNDGSYEPVSSAGDDGDSVLRHPVTFNADVNPTFDATRAVDEDEERRLDDENKIWS